MWNYRIGTRINKHSLELGMSEEQSREYFLMEVYYDKQGNPDGYSEGLGCSIITNELNEIESTLDLMRKALFKPVIDLDNFPQEF